MAYIVSLSLSICFRLGNWPPIFGKFSIHNQDKNGLFAIGELTEDRPLLKKEKKPCRPFVHLFVRKNFYNGQSFWLVSDRAFIFLIYFPLLFVDTKRDHDIAVVRVLILNWKFLVCSGPYQFMFYISRREGVCPWTNTDRVRQWLWNNDRRYWQWKWQVQE